MAIRTIRLNGDEILRKKSKPVKEVNERIKILLDDMIETMYESNGVGLAAPQVGVLKRVVIIQLNDESELFELINPEILELRGEQINSEGCLSVPNQSGYVARPEYIKIKALDRNGNEIIVEAEDFLAVAFCHELDHLDGVLYIDKLIPEDELEELEEFDDEFDDAYDGEDLE